MRLQRWTKEWGTLTEAGLRRKLEEEGFHVSRHVYPPGTQFPDHAHHVDKIDGVLSGRLLLRSGSGEVFLGPGDFVEVPAGTVHSVEVVGDEPVVSLGASR